MGKSRLGNQTKRPVWSTINYAMNTGRLKNRQDGEDGEENAKAPDESRAGAESEDKEET